MSLSLEQQFEIDASQQDTWDFFWDIPAMARCVPGCETVEPVEPPSHYRASVRRKLGPFLVRMELDVMAATVVDGASLEVRIDGEDRKLRSTVQQTIQVHLSSNSPTATHVTIRVDATLSGLLAKLGLLLVRIQLESAVDEFVDALRTQLLSKVSE